MWKYLSKRLNLAILLIILFAAQSRADDFLEHVTFDTPQPPGAVIIRYGGLRGLFFDECESQIINLWSDRIQLVSNYSPTVFDRNRGYETLSNLLSDARTGGRWWTRAWYYSLPPEKGGAPLPQVYDQDHVSMDFGLFQVNSKFKVKMKEFAFTVGDEGRFSNKFVQTDFWRIKVKPQVTFGQPYGIRRCGLSLVFEWHLSRKKTWEIELFTRYSGEKRAMAGIEISLIRW